MKEVGIMKKLSALFLTAACMFLLSNVANAEELIVNNHGESTVLEETISRSRSLETTEYESEAYDPGVSIMGRSLQLGTELPDDIGYPRTPDGFDYSEISEESVEDYNPLGRAVVNNRSRVSNPNTFPYRASVLIIVDYKKPNGTTVRGHGSGSMIGPNKVMTAAHVLYDRTYGWASTVRVYPAVKNNYTDYNMAYGSTLYTFGGYISASNGSLSAQQKDVGIVKLDSNLGNSTGWYGYTTSRTSYLRLNGYDGDIDDGRSLVTRAGSNTRVENGIVKYPWKTSGGLSGGGLYNPSNNMLEGLHAYSYSQGNVQMDGGGAKINGTIFDFMSKY